MFSFVLVCFAAGGHKHRRQRGKKFDDAVPCRFRDKNCLLYIEAIIELLWTRKGISRGGGTSRRCVIDQRSEGGSNRECDDMLQEIVAGRQSHLGERGAMRILTASG